MILTFVSSGHCRDTGYQSKTLLFLFLVCFASVVPALLSWGAEHQCSLPPGVQCTPTASFQASSKGAPDGFTAALTQPRPMAFGSILALTTQQARELHSPSSELQTHLLDSPHPSLGENPSLSTPQTHSIL